MLSNSEKIKRYLRDLPPAVLGIRNIDSVQILEMTPGSYNFNYHVRVNQKHFIFRINIEQQSGLRNQIEYEFEVLKFLEDYRLAPKVYHFDNSQEVFDFDILIEDYLNGDHLSLEDSDISNAVELLVQLHSLDPVNKPFVIWRDPLVDTYELARNDLLGYESKKTADKKTVRLAKKLLAKTEAMVLNYRHLFHADSLNHTDVVCDNFIKTPQGLRLIDWEKPRVDDCTYDICCFLCDPAEMWCSPKVLTSEERVNFINTYAYLRRKNTDHLMAKVNIREPLVSLHWILWGASKLCDLKERRTMPELLQAHEEKSARYGRIANPENIEKLLVSLRFPD